jgi:restriction system protein
MAVWVVRAGRHGEREQFALDNSLAVIGWDELPDLGPISGREQLEQLCRRTYPQEKPNTVTNWVAQIWAFRDRIQVGDLIVLPLKTRSAIAIARATGPYQYRADSSANVRHTRPVEWLNKEIPRSAFGQDILYSFGAFLTVCQVQRNQAEQRIRAVLAGKPAPPGAPLAQTNAAEATVDTTAPPDLEAYATEQIRARIEQKFKGHDLARLVDELLKAQGYRTHRSPAGPDGGVDIIAGGGAMGFDAPASASRSRPPASPSTSPSSASSRAS